MKNNSRPKHLNLFKIRLPYSGIASILHRLSGALLFLATPLLLYILTTSFKNNSGFNEISACIDSVFFDLLLIVLVWSIVHHFLAGLRYLVLDLDIGISKGQANTSAVIVTVLGLVISIILVMGVLK